MTDRSRTLDAETIKSKAAEAGQQAADSLKSAAEQQVGDATDTAAARVENVAQATSAARSELPADSPVDPLLGQAVDALGQVAEHLRHADIQSLTRDVGDYAKRHPVLALGGAALVGFAAARFLKAGTPPDRKALAGDPWAGHEERS
ncbi:hypothetical protein [uncultured Tateyamaria sp.]|uniref:hypothetical protein n=1 Tax=uncultured Tateyamaria sp. TaxID=455651 RepID=UPI002611A5D5|nr:hypothetical protein [uncultured Tateyamaria sp.]